MSDKRLVRVILLDLAKEQFEELNRIVREQQAEGIRNSEEMQLIDTSKADSQDLGCLEFIPR